MPIDKNCRENLRNILNEQLKKGTCLVPQQLQSHCDTKCSAHSISKESVLRKISEANHLICFHNRFDFEIGTIEPSKIGINKASTFLGFCAAHDSSLFKDIDIADPKITKKNCFLLGYRALCKDFFETKCTIQTLKQAINETSLITRRQFRLQLKMKNVTLGEGRDSGFR